MSVIQAEPGQAGQAGQTRQKGQNTRIRHIGLLIALLLASATISPKGRAASDGLKEDYRLDEAYPPAKASYYSTRILKFLEHWPPATLAPNNDRPFLRAIRTPSLSDTVGMVKHFIVKAPFEKVVEANERFEDYPKIWKEVVSVNVISRDRNRTITDWTRKAPAFFLPRIHYKMLYVSDKTIPGRVVYRQQLIEGNVMNTSDGLVVVEKLGNETTRISVVNFFEASLGALKPLVGGKIWKKSMEGSFKDDIAFCARLEHPNWKIDQITDAAEEALDHNPIDHVEYTDLLKFD